MSTTVKPDELVNVVSTKSWVGGLDCWSPITTTFAPLINWFVEERTKTFKIAGSVGSHELNPNNIIKSKEIKTPNLHLLPRDQELKTPNQKSGVRKYQLA